MAADSVLEERLDGVFHGRGIGKKKMFGGLCYLHRGNMLCGIYKDFLIVRLGGPEAAKSLEKPHTRPFDITGKAMKGWVMVEPEGYAGAALKKWVEAAESFVDGLPDK